MSTLIRSALVALALIGTVAAASAGPASPYEEQSYFEQQTGRYGH